MQKLNLRLIRQPAEENHTLNSKGQQQVVDKINEIVEYLNELEEKGKVELPSFMEPAPKP